MIEENNEIDLDKLSDEEFMQMIESGSTEVESDEEEEENLEDTDQSEESEDDVESESETNDLNDDEDQETEDDAEETEDDEDEENTQLEDDAEDETENEDEEDEETETKEEESEETDEKPEDTEEINYESEYKKILEEKQKFETFYNEVTSEFTANGKKMKGFTDPKKVIQAQQMAAGFSEKMAGFKPYRPFMSAIKDRGIIEDPEKFNLAMSLLDGDPEAIKQHIKNLEIDPFEMDMENINYTPKNQISSDLEIAFDDVLENATKHNVKDRVQNIISKEWDDGSVIELLEDPQSSADLISHISSGAYDVVQERISEKKRVDINNVFSRKPSIEQYREAASELEAEYVARQNQAQASKEESTKIDESAVEAEKNRIAREREEEEYRAKVKAENAKAAAARKKATSVSKKKPRAKTTKKVFDPGELNDDEFMDIISGFVNS